MSIDPSQPPDRKPAARIVDSGLGTTYHPGDVARGYIVVANTGDRLINKITVNVTVFSERLFGLPAGHQTETFNVGLSPGESTRVEYSQKIPREVMGISTRGSYRLEASIEADGVHVTTIKKHVGII